MNSRFGFRHRLPNYRRIYPGAAALTLVLTAGLGACSSNEERDEFVLHYTTYTSATSDQSRTVQRWAKEVEEKTKGGVSVNFHYSESLVNAEEAVPATLDGRADIAQAGSIYTSSDLSMFTVIELPFETSNPQVQMTAVERLYAENEAYRQDFARQGIRLLYPLPLGVAMVGLKSPAKSLDDLQGRSLRAGGLTSEVFLAKGINPVAMTAVDIYESMTRGVIDGYSSLAIANLPTFGLSQTTPHVLEPGIGAYSSSIVIINEDLFQSMPQEYQDTILDVSGKVIDYGLEEMDKLGETACDELLASGTDFSTLPPEQVTEWKKSAGLDAKWVNRYEERGYDAQGVLDDYRRIIDEETETSRYADPLIGCMKKAKP